MKTIIVDDELWMLTAFEDECKDIADVEIVGKFQNPLKALDFAREKEIELAFLDVEMPEMNGLELSQELRKINSDMIIIFISAFDQYMADAFELEADYYVMKPYTHEKIVHVVDRAKLLSERLKKRVFIKTFGTFDVFVDEIPIKFSSSKAKELLAYLVDQKGSIVNTEKGFTALWEERAYDHAQAASYRKVLARLQETLKKYEIENIVYILPRGRAINVNAIDCDYYKFLDGDVKYVNEFKGEYMSDYSWGEFTLALLYNNSSFMYSDEL